jgi:thiosulfate/3-mercaptopyruvate sulfurtransferase
VAEDFLIDPRELMALINEAAVTVIDCRYSLQQPELGEQQYLESHIPGACYAHLDEDLSSPVVRGKTGRHPLPRPDQLQELLRSWGITSDSAVVVYDHANGGIAARAWWLLKWAGIPNVRMLNGGWQAWKSAGLPVSSDPPEITPSAFSLSGGHRAVIGMSEIPGFIKRQGNLLVDARTAERYRGELEPIDPVAGHIPGAHNLPWMTNVKGDGTWLSSAQVRHNFKQIGLTGDVNVAVYCGSGVTACHLAFAYEYAGLGTAILYPGSWSEWITDLANSIAR